MTSFLRLPTVPVAVPAVLAVLVLSVLAGCQTPPKTEAKRESLMDDSQAAVTRFQREDPGLRDFMANSYGHAIFPEVGKGGLVVGGAYGKGVVYQQGNAVGYSDMSQATI